MRRVFVSSVLAMMAACAIVPPSDLKPPKLGLSDLAIKAINLGEIRFSAMLSADNPNAYALPLTDTRVELSVMGQSIATGTTQQPRIELAASTVTPVPVDITVSTTKALSIFRQLTAGSLGQLSYQLKGDAKWGALGLPLNFEKKGDLEGLKRLGELMR